MQKVFKYQNNWIQQLKLCINNRIQQAQLYCIQSINNIREPVDPKFRCLLLVSVFIITLVFDIICTESSYCDDIQIHHQFLIIIMVILIIYAIILIYKKYYINII